MSELRRRGPGAEVGFSGQRALLWGGSMALPGGSAAAGSESLPLPDSPSLGHGGSSGGLPGNHSNFPAPSGWVGRQVHPVNWLQGSGKKSAGCSWGCRCDLLPADSPQKRTELPLDFQPSSPVSSSSQRDKTDRARQSQGGVFNIIMAAVETVHITQNQSKEQDLPGTMWGEETNPTLLSTVPGGYRNVTLGVQPAETWCPKQGSCHSRSRGWGGGVTLETVGVCPQVPGLGTVWASPPTWVRNLGLETPRLLLTCSVPFSSEIPSLWTEAVALINPWSFLFCFLVTFIWGQDLWVSCCGVFCWVQTFGGVLFISWHVIYLIHRVTSVWYPPDWPHVISFSFCIVVELIFNVLF